MTEEGEISESPDKNNQHPNKVTVPTMTSLSSTNQPNSYTSNNVTSSDNNNDRRYGNLNISNSNKDFDQLSNKSSNDGNNSASREDHDLNYYGPGVARDYIPPRDNRLYPKNISRIQPPNPQPNLVRSNSRDPYEREYERDYNYQVERDLWPRDREYHPIDLNAYSARSSNYIGMRPSYNTMISQTESSPRYRNYGEINTRSFYGPPESQLYPLNYNPARPEHMRSIPPNQYDERLYEDRSYDDRVPRPHIKKTSHDRFSNQPSPRPRETIKPIQRSYSEDIGPKRILYPPPPPVRSEQDYSYSQLYQDKQIVEKTKQPLTIPIPNVPPIDKLIASNAMVPGNTYVNTIISSSKPIQNSQNYNNSFNTVSNLTPSSVYDKSNSNPSSISNNTVPSLIQIKPIAPVFSPMMTEVTTKLETSEKKSAKPINIPAKDSKLALAKETSPFPISTTVSRSVDDILGLKKTSSALLPLRHSLKSSADEEDDNSNNIVSTPRFSVSNSNRTRIAWGQGIVRRVSESSISQQTVPETTIPIENVIKTEHLASEISTTSTTESIMSTFKKEDKATIEPIVRLDMTKVAAKSSEKPKDFKLSGFFLPESSISLPEDSSPMMSSGRKRGRKPGSKVVRGHVVSAEELLNMPADEEIDDEEQSVEEEEIKVEVEIPIETPLPVESVHSDSDDEPNEKRIRKETEISTTIKSEEEIEVSKRRRGRKPNNISKKLNDVFESAISDEIQIPNDLSHDSNDDDEEADNLRKKLGRPFGKSVTRGRGGGRGEGGRGRGNFRKSIDNADVVPPITASLMNSTIITGKKTKLTTFYQNQAPTSALIFHSTKSRSLLGTMVSTPEDVYRTFHAIRYMVELQQYASSDKTDFVKLLTSNVSIPPTVAKIPLPTNHEICYCLELLEGASDILYDHLIDIKRKQYLLEGIWTNNFRDRMITKTSNSSPANQTTIPSLQSNLLNLADEKRNDSKLILRKRFGNYSTNLKNTISTIYEHNKLRIAEAHLYATVLPQMAGKTNSPSVSTVSTSFSSYNNMTNSINKNRQQVKTPITPVSDIISLASKGISNSSNAIPNLNPSSPVKTISKSLNKASLSTTTMKPPTETQQFKTTAQRIIQIRPYMINEIRKRKMIIRKTWEELGDKYLEAHAKWDHEVNSDNNNNNESINNEINSNLSNNNNIGYLTSGQRSSNRFLGVTQPLEFDANGFQVLPQVIAENRYLNGAAAIPPLVSPWIVSDPMNDYPAPPTWPITTNPSRYTYSVPSQTSSNFSGAGSSLKKIKSKLPPGISIDNNKVNAVNGTTISSFKLPYKTFVEIHEPVDFSSNRYTIDGKRQNCIGLDIHEKCPKYCNCMRQVDKKIEKTTKIWTDIEKTIFLDKFLQFPKNFTKISKFLTNRSIKEVIKFYYDSKATIPFKALLKEIDNKRKNMKNLNINTNYSAKSVGCGYYSTVRLNNNTNLNNVAIGSYNSANAFSSMSNSIVGNSNEVIIQLPVDDMTFNTFLHHPPYLADSLGLPRPMTTTNTSIYPVNGLTPLGPMPSLPVVIPRANTILQANKRFINLVNEIKLKCQYNDIDDLPDDYEDILKLSNDKNGSNTYYNLQIYNNSNIKINRTSDATQRTIDQRSLINDGTSTRGRGMKVGGRRGGRGRGSSGLERSNSLNNNESSTVNATNITSMEDDNKNDTSASLFKSELPLPPLARRKHSKDYGKVTVNTMTCDSITTATIITDNVTVPTKSANEVKVSNSSSLGNLTLNYLKLDQHTSNMLGHPPPTNERSISFTSVSSAYIPADVTLFSSNIPKVTKPRKPKTPNTTSTINPSKLSSSQVKSIKSINNTIKANTNLLAKAGINTKVTNIVKLPAGALGPSGLPMSLNNYIKSGLNQNVSKGVGLYSSNPLKKPKLATTQSLTNKPITTNQTKESTSTSTVEEGNIYQNRSIQEKSEHESVSVGYKRDFSSLSSSLPSKLNITSVNPFLTSNKQIESNEKSVEESLSSSTSYTSDKIYDSGVSNMTIIGSQSTLDGTIAVNSFESSNNYDNILSNPSSYINSNVDTILDNENSNNSSHSENTYIIQTRDV